MPRWTLLLWLGVLGSARQVLNPQVPWGQVRGPWRTLYLAASNASAIAELGPLRTFVRMLACREPCRSLAVTFYVRSGGLCQKKQIKIHKNRQSLSQATFQGKVFPMIDYVKDNVLLAHYFHVDLNDVTTRVALALVRGRADLSAEQKKLFSMVMGENGIEKNSVRRVGDSDTCPE